MGIKVRGSIGELCNQGCSKGNNDINKLELHNRKANLTCGQNTSRKDFNNITSCYFQKRSSSKTTS